MTLLDYYKHIQQPAALALWVLERAGLRIDTKRRLAHYEAHQREIDAATAETGVTNFASHKQIAAFLYGRLKLPVQHKRKRVTTEHKALVRLLGLKRITPEQRTALRLVIALSQADDFCSFLETRLQKGRLYPSYSLHISPFGQIVMSAREKYQRHAVPSVLDDPETWPWRYRDVVVSDSGCALVGGTWPDQQQELARYFQTQGYVAMQEVQKHRRLRTPFGWTRWYFAPKPTALEVVTFPVRATQADCMKIALPMVVRAAAARGGCALAVTRNSFLAEAPTSEAEALAGDMREILNYQFRVLGGLRFHSEVAVGETWQMV